MIDEKRENTDVQKQHIQKQIDKVRKNTLLWQLAYIGFVGMCFAGAMKAKSRCAESTVVRSAVAGAIAMASIDALLLHKEMKLRKSLKGKGQ